MINCTCRNAYTPIHYINLSPITTDCSIRITLMVSIDLQLNFTCVVFLRLILQVKRLAVAVQCGNAAAVMGSARVWNTCTFFRFASLFPLFVSCVIFLAFNNFASRFVYTTCILFKLLTHHYFVLLCTIVIVISLYIHALLIFNLVV